MPARSGSGSIDSIRPSRLTWSYASPSESTVSAARGSARMCASRSRLKRMFRSTRPSSQSYQVAAVCGAPSGRRVAITARYGFASTAATSGGTGALGIRLLRPAREPAVRLPQRHRGVVVLDVLARILELRPHVGAELLLGRAAAHRVRPVVQLEAEIGEVALHVVEDPEVDEREPVRRTALERRDRRLPCVDVDLGRRRRRHHVAAGRDSDACRVAGIERAVADEVADVVRCMARRREAVEAEHVRADDADVRLGHGHELAPQRVEGVAVEPARAALEPFRIDEVRRADLGNVHLQTGMLAHERPRRARVVEVDVAEQQVTDVLEREALRREACTQRLDRRRRPAVEERRAVVRVEQVRADCALPAEMLEVDEDHAATTAETTTASEATNSNGSCSTDPSERAKTTWGRAPGTIASNASRGITSATTPSRSMRTGPTSASNGSNGAGASAAPSSMQSSSAGTCSRPGRDSTGSSQSTSRRSWSPTGATQRVTP